MTPSDVEKYSRPVRILHWVHSGAFIILFLTGLVLFIPQLRSLAEDSWIRLVHRAGATIFIIIPVIYMFINPKTTWRGLKNAFTWGGEDLEWLKNAPRYYFLGDDKNIPPQGFLNSGQKMWWLITIFSWMIFVITGLAMWFAKLSVSPGFLQAIISVHDIAFIATGAMFFLHLYLGVFHPLMTEAWNAMARGKISTEYAKKHHGKWYAEISRDKEPQKGGDTESPKA
jgi:formate dehydrogenase subunit gamma